MILSGDSLGSTKNIGFRFGFQNFGFGKENPVSLPVPIYSWDAAINGLATTSVKTGTWTVQGFGGKLGIKSDNTLSIINFNSGNTFAGPIKTRFHWFVDTKSPGTINVGVKIGFSINASNTGNTGGWVAGWKSMTPANLLQSLGGRWNATALFWIGDEATTPTQQFTHIETLYPSGPLKQYITEVWLEQNTSFPKTFSRTSMDGGATWLPTVDHGGSKVQGLVSFVMINSGMPARLSKVEVFNFTDI